MSYSIIFLLGWCLGMWAMWYMVKKNWWDPNLSNKRNEIMEPKFLIEINYHENDSDEGVSGDVDYLVDQRLIDFIHRYGRRGKDRVVLMLAKLMGVAEGYYQEFSKSVDADMEESGDIGD